MLATSERALAIFASLIIHVNYGLTEESKTYIIIARLQNGLLDNQILPNENESMSHTAFKARATKVGMKMALSVELDRIRNIVNSTRTHNKASLDKSQEAF